MIRIVETLKEFRAILLGQILRIYTDNKNCTCMYFNTDRLLRWRLILGDYALEIEYIKGKRDIVAYALSILLLNGNRETKQDSNYKK